MHTKINTLIQYGVLALCLSGIGLYGFQQMSADTPTQTPCQIGYGCIGATVQSHTVRPLYTNSWMRTLSGSVFHLYKSGSSDIMDTAISGTDGFARFGNITQYGTGEFMIQQASVASGYSLDTTQMKYALDIQDPDIGSPSNILMGLTSGEICGGAQAGVYDQSWCDSWKWLYVFAPYADVVLPSFFGQQDIRGASGQIINTLADFSTIENLYYNSTQYPRINYDYSWVNYGESKSNINFRVQSYKDITPTITEYINTSSTGITLTGITDTFTVDYTYHHFFDAISSVFVEQAGATNVIIPFSGSVSPYLDTISTSVVTNSLLFGTYTFQHLHIMTGSVQADGSTPFLVQIDDVDALLAEVQYLDMLYYDAMINNGMTDDDYIHALSTISFSVQQKVKSGAPGFTEANTSTGIVNNYDRVWMSREYQNSSASYTGNLFIKTSNDISSNTVTIQYDPIVYTYTREYFLSDGSGAYTATPSQVETGTGAPGSILFLDPTARSFTGYTFDSSASGNVLTANLSIASGTLMRAYYLKSVTPPIPTSPTPVNGQCTSYTGSIASGSSLGNLCITGAPTGLSLSGSTFTWSCMGSNSGTNSICSVQAQLPTNTGTVTVPPVISSGGGGGYVSPSVTPVSIPVQTTSIEAVKNTAVPPLPSAPVVLDRQCISAVKNLDDPRLGSYARDLRVVDFSDIDRTLTRVEFLKIVLNAQKADLASASGVILGFKDIEANSWYAPYVQYGVMKGIVSGSGSAFRPHDKLSRAEAAKILVTAFGMSLGTNSDPFADIWNVGDMRTYIVTAYEGCLLHGKNTLNGVPLSGPRLFVPYDKISLGETMKILYNEKHK